MYGKLTEEGTLIPAPADYELEDGRIIKNFNTSGVMLKKYGFKQVIDFKPVVTDDEYLIEDGYEESEDTIIIKYLIKTPDDALTLEEFKRNRIQESKDNLAEFLFTHPITSTAHNPKGGVYAVTIEHQNRLAGNIMTYQLAAMAGQPGYITWNETGEPCEVWTIEQATQLALEMKVYVTPMISLQQHMEMDIEKCATKEEVAEIGVEFIDEIVEQYRQEFNDMLVQ